MNNTSETRIQAVLQVFKDWGNLSGQYEPNPFTADELRELATEVIAALENK